MRSNAALTSGASDGDASDGDAIRGANHDVVPIEPLSRPAGRPAEPLRPHRDC
jgi:hypothetical protein